MTPSKALVSFWTPPRRAFISSSDLVTVSITSDSNSAYFSLPCVSRQTMEISAAPSAPDRAAALPPPGAGALDASFSEKALTVMSVKIMFIPPCKVSSFFEAP